MKSVLFLYRGSSQNSSAYSERLRMLQNGIEKLGVRTDSYYLGDRRLTSSTLFPIYLPHLVRIFRNYDIIHAGGPSCGFVANLGRKLHGCKVISDIHGDRISEIKQEKKAGKSRNEIGIFPLTKVGLHEIGATYFSDYYLTSSYPLKKMLHSRGVSEAKIFVIRSGVDLELFSQSDSNSHANIIVTYAGQFQTYQAVGDLIEAAKRIPDRKIRFRIIGFTPSDMNIKNSIRERLGNRVELIDRVSQEDLVRHLQDSDVLVIPRRRSRVTAVAFPTKFAEYIALGKPVIVSDVDETIRFVKKYNCGLVCRPGIDGLERTLLKMKELSPKILREMGKNGRQLAERVFDWNIVCKKYYDVISHHIKV